MDRPARYVKVVPWCFLGEISISAQGQIKTKVGHN
jgi:hypothetical protein